MKQRSEGSTFPLSPSVLLSYYPTSFSGLAAQGTNSEVLFTEESDAKYLLLLLENADDSKKQFWKYKKMSSRQRGSYWILAFIFNFI